MRQLPVKADTMTTDAASPLMTPAEAAATLGITTRQLRTMRRRNTGPTFYTLGPRLVRYSRVDVERHRAGR